MQGYAEAAAVELFAGFKAVAAESEEWVAGPVAAGLGHAELEREVVTRGRELARLLLQACLDLRAVREQRSEGVRAADGSPRPRAEKGRTRQLATAAGQVSVPRIGYRAPGRPIVYPADELLSLPAHKYSAGLGELVARAAAGGSYEAAVAAVERCAGVRVGKRQAEQLARRAAADFEGFYAGCPRPVHEGVLVLEADGKGVMMRPGSLRPRNARKAARAAPKLAGRLTRGEVRTRKRMAEVGAVFDIEPVPRTAADILPGPGAAASGDAPKAQGKWLTASVAADTAQVIAQVFAEASRRDPARSRAWVALADGNKDQIRQIQAQAAARGITIPLIIDFIHVSEYLWDAAWSFHPEASPHAASWVRAHARAILDGHASDTADAIRAQAAATPGLSAAKRKAAQKTARYLDAKAPFLDYPHALAAGWPISTGVIEGACRHLVKDRMDITGARWTTNGAEAILKLRALLANNDWDRYWHYHLQQEHQRTYRNHRNCYQLAA